MFRRNLKFEISSTSKLLILEILVLGRLASGEFSRNCYFSDQWRVYRDQKLVFADNFFLSNENDISSKTRLGYNKSIMVLVLSGLNCANTLLKIRSVIANYPCDAGSSEWNDLLVVKVLSEYPECLRDIGKKLVELFSGDPRVVPRIWIA